MLQESKEAFELRLTLDMMSRIEREPAISQRGLSTHLGVAIGLVNTYLKRCIQKGWIKVRNIPTKRYAYYLTPGGFIEKAKLTAEYLSSGFEFFRQARNELLMIFHECEAKNWINVILIGKGDLSEIALQVVKETTIKISIIFKEEFLKIQHYDAVIITDTETPQSTYTVLINEIPERRIFIPPLLRVYRMLNLQEAI
jgi:hypothetical protein